MPDASFLSLSTAPIVVDEDGDSTIDIARVGGKGHGLWRLREARVVVPPFAVITADNVAAIAEGADAVLLQHVLTRLGGELFAVRSSAVDEDSAAASFAGQHHSAIGVRAVDVVAAIAACARSFASPGALAYRRAHRLPERASGAVILQALVVADVAGVAFSVDPIDGRDVVVVSACLGFGEGVVADRAPADTFRIDSAGEVAAILERKDHRLVLAHDGGCVDDKAIDAALQLAPALDDAVLRTLAETVRALAVREGRAVDVEWTWTRTGGLAFVQVRPITALAATTSPAAATSSPASAPRETPTRYLFDTSNIAESYPGVTSPLTFSHIKLAYTTAYQASARLCGVADDEIAAHERSFSTLLARIDGRVHYHLPSWFQVLALYPGSERNRALMLEMMGAEALSSSSPSPLSSSIVPLPPTRSVARQVAMALRMTKTFAARHRLVDDFHAAFEQVLVPLENTRWGDVVADDVVEQWHSVRHRLLHGWQAPLLADFLAMTSHGALRSMCASRGVDDVTIADLFAGADIPSVAPARALVVLARQLARNANVREAFVAADVDTALKLLRADPIAGAGFALFLTRFGARAMHELKLEQPTWRDEPGFVVRQLQDLVRQHHSRRDDVTDDDDDIVAAGLTRARLAERSVRAQLSWSQRLVFGRLLRAARRWTGHREAMRYARARTFAVLRSMALRLGDVLVDGGRLEHRRDVFFLEHDELTGVFDGTATTYDVRGLVTLRRAEDAASKAHAPLDDRLSFSRGVIFGPSSAPTASPTSSPSADDRAVVRGVPVVRGVARGRVRIVAEAADATDVPGHILVCPRTDPGFAALFPGALALVVERGSPLSHCAIVARELGLPTIVNARGIVRAAQAAGDVDVVVDGAAGTVTFPVSP